MTDAEKALVDALVDHHKVAIHYTEAVEPHKELLFRMIGEGLLIPSNPNLIVTRKLKELMDWR